MITASFDPLRRGLWNAFIHVNHKRMFRDTVIPYPIEAHQDRSILLLANHVSWWDGFWAVHLNEKCWKKRFHVMMLEKELAARKFLRHVGAFSIDPGNRSVVESLRYTAEVLDKPSNMVALFPQGKIWSFHNRLIDFGVAPQKIIQWTQQPVQVLLGVTFVDFFQYHKPTLYYYLKEWKGNDEPT